MGLMAEKIASWLFSKLGLEHDETWGSDHLDYNDTVKELLKLLDSRESR